MTKQKQKNPLELFQEAVQETQAASSTGAAPISSFTYGSEKPIEDILNHRLPQAEKEGEGDVGIPPAQELPRMTEAKTNYYSFAQGGAPLNIQQAFARGGREDHRYGKHVEGPGDGQSDDIPAWLADGEFVFPADVVSALGNGSTKAGTLKLYEMMHNIRKRARSSGHKDLPPAAFKSPLDYIKGNN